MSRKSRSVHLEPAGFVGDISDPFVIRRKRSGEYVTAGRRCHKRLVVGTPHSERRALDFAGGAENVSTVEDKPPIARPGANEHAPGRLQEHLLLAPSGNRLQPQLIVIHEVARENYIAGIRRPDRALVEIISESQTSAERSLQIVDPNIRAGPTGASYGYPVAARRERTRHEPAGMVSHVRHRNSLPLSLPLTPSHTLPPPPTA